MRVLITAAPFYSDPDDPRATDICPPLSIYLLASVAEAAGHEARVLDPCLYENLQSDKDFVKTFAGFDALCFSATSSTWPETARTLSRLDLKGADRPKVILGGLHASLFDEYILRRFSVDYIVRGEGEKAFPHLLDAIERGHDPVEVHGISFLQGEKLVRTPDGPMLTRDELDEIPIPRYDLIPEGYYRLIPVETSRGCLYRCVFCSLGTPRGWRGRSPQSVARILDRAREFLHRVRDGSLHIIDDCFLSRNQDLEELTRVLGGSGTPLVLNSRVNEFLDPVKLKSYVRLNVSLCEIGVECGYKDGLRKTRKGITLEQVEECARVLRERALIDRINFSYIMGLPWEGRKEAVATIKYAFDLAKKYGGGVELSWYLLYPGSEIYFHPETYGVEMANEIYDQRAWWRDEDLFYRMKPNLSRQDIRDILYLLSFYKQFLPGIRTYLWLEEKD
jgi:anaerobic magnesium-protoporphyrin IX monomethyl ester cyclase